MPILGKDRQENTPSISDFLLLDVDRQNNSLEERFRPGQLNISNLRELSDVATRYHIAMSRGLERDIIKSFNRMDAEHYNRATIKPMVD